MNFPKKNFVGELQEKCQLVRGAMPVYLDESMGNTYIFTCKLNDWVCRGIGKSKRFAKQIAAQKMLDKIEYGKLLSGTSGKNDRNLKKSSITNLIEYCTKKKMDPPLFSDLRNDGNLFCCKCSLNSFSAVGTGNSKKEAKEKAAFEVGEHFEVHKHQNDELIKSEEQMLEIPPVTELSMFCKKKRLGVPVYGDEVIMENRVVKYKINCSVGDLKIESGLSHSKKSAKSEVATLMLQTLRSNTPEGSPVEEDLNPALKRDSETLYSSDSENSVMEPLKKHMKIDQ